MEKKKEYVLVLASTGDMAFALGNALIGLKKHSPDLINNDLIVYEQGISLGDKIALSKITQIKFIEYECPIKNIDTPIKYARYECFNLLAHYKNVLYLDTDIIIKQDITGIFEAITEGDIALKYLPEIDENNKTIFDIRDKINLGVMLMNEWFPEYQTLTELCYEQTKQIINSSKNAQEELFLSIFDKFNVLVKSLRWSLNLHPTDQYAKNAHILHSFGAEKFWDFYEDEDWNENYKTWLELGGSPAPVKKLTVLQKLLFQKTVKNIDKYGFRKEQDFIDYMLCKYGLEAYENLKKVDKLVKAGIISSKR